MKWTKSQGVLIIFLIVLSIVLIIFSDVLSSNDDVINELRIAVNPSYQAVLNNELENATLHYRFIEIGDVDEWSKISLIESRLIVEEENRYKMIMPIFEASSLEQFVVFEIPKELIHTKFPYVMVLIIIAHVIILIIISINMMKKKHSYEDLIKGLNNISIGKFEEIEESDELHITYNKTIYELRLVKEQYLRQNIKNSLFLSAVSHELKTPLATIMAHLEAFEHGIGNSEKKRDAYLAIIKNKFHQLSTQIEDFFKYAQDQSGHFKYNLQEVYFDEYMNNWFEGLDNKINYQNMLPKCLVNLDKVRIEQVLENLYNNACKHTNTSIDIITYREDDFVVVEVKDDGDGIKPKDLPHIFDFYYQGENSKKMDYEGVGMGLALCKQMVDVHQGKILVRSSVGVGTTVIFKIPVC